MKQTKNIDEYITSSPLEVRDRLNQIRQVVKEVASEATEKLSYRMPYFSLNGRLLYFAAQCEHHIGFYPMKSALRQFREELSEYETSAGTVRFPFDKPLPLELIRKIVKFRAEENQAKAKKK